MSWLYEPWIFVCMEIIESELSNTFAAQSPLYGFAPSSGKNRKNILSRSYGSCPDFADKSRWISLRVP